MEIEAINLDRREALPNMRGQEAEAANTSAISAQDPTDWVNSQLPVVVPLPIPEFEYTDYNAIRDQLLEEMDGIADPFEQMMFALMVLMPTLLSMKEQDLASLGHTQQVISLYGEKLEELQTYYNEVKDMDPDSWDTMVFCRDKLYVAAAQLQQYLQLDTVLDPETRASFKAEVDAFVQQFSTYMYNERNGYTGWGGVATAFTFMWDSTPYFYEDPDLPGHDVYYDEKIEGLKAHRNNLEMFQMGSTALSSESKVVNALVDYDAEQYNGTTALYKDMFKNYYKQIEANIRNFDPSRS